MNRILIAEDDRFLANICRKKFEEAGCEVVVAVDGHQAINELIRQPPAVLILDLMLPEIDGVAVLQFLRSRENLRHLPVIVVSSSDYFSGVVQAAWAAGATHFLKKGDCGPNKLVEKSLELVGFDLASPRPVVAHHAPASITQTVEPPKTVKGPARILIADDDKLIHGVLSFFLTQAGFTVRSAYDGRQAMEMAIAQAPDLLVLDSLMPEMDGNQVLEQWNVHPVLSKIPVIVLSGIDDERKKAKSLGNGAVAYLTKPFSPDDLVVKVKHYTGRT